MNSFTGRAMNSQIYCASKSLHHFHCFSALYDSIGYGIGTFVNDSCVLLCRANIQKQRIQHAKKVIPGIGCIIKAYFQRGLTIIIIMKKKTVTQISIIYPTQSENSCCVYGFVFLKKTFSTKLKNHFMYKSISNQS